jgi:hypothetical protein
MSVAKTLYFRALVIGAFVALPLASMAASTGPLQVQNNEPGTITLTSQSPGVCGTWVSPTGLGAPPASVAGSSTSGQFQLVVSPSCGIGINVASATYLFTQGDLVSSCTYTITGNSPFSFKASGVAGCKILFTPDGGILFVFPDTVGLRVRGHSTNR